nr:FAD-dependent monooxygenase [Amycolatopsis sp. NBC_01488]
MNLGWKLAAHLRGRAPAGLLDSYEAKRRAVASGVLQNVAAQNALIPMTPDQPREQLVPQWKVRPADKTPATTPTSGDSRSKGAKTPWPDLTTVLIRPDGDVASTRGSTESWLTQEGNQTQGVQGGEAPWRGSGGSTPRGKREGGAARAFREHTPPTSVAGTGFEPATSGL